MTPLLTILAACAMLFLVRWWRLPANDRSWLTLRRPLAGLIKKRLHGYRVETESVDNALKTNLSEPKRALVVGGGLAGIAAAEALASRGFEVTLREKNTYLGGKIGAWKEQVGRDAVQIEHGFHAFFRHYYNLNRFLERAGVTPHLRAIDDYLILERSGRGWRFAGIETTPALNLVALARAGLYRFRDILVGPALHKMDAFLRYDATDTFESLDHVSYEQFAREAELPPTLRLVFNTFSRAFFSDPDRLSMAELVKSFHFYYLSHDHGLLYDYPDGDYEHCVLAPIADHLERLGATVELGRGVGEIKPEKDGRLVVDDITYDHVVLATSSVGAKAVAAQSPSLMALDTVLAGRLGKLVPSQRYAVLRLWFDRDVRNDIPVFVATERIATLDAVALVHRIAPEAQAYAATRGGSVLELHCYALPDELADEDVAEAMTAELRHYFPELGDCPVVDQHLQLNQNFTAFNVGMSDARPQTETAIGALTLAGDWVKLPFPAMLMEAAYSSGLVAANAILRREGLRTEAVFSVPQRGLLADVPKLGAPREPTRSEAKPRATLAPASASAEPQRR